MSKLFIVESPNKIAKIKHYLEELGIKDFNVEASYGHIRDLPNHEMGVDLKSFTPTYLITDDKKKVTDKLIAATKKANEIYLATDPDREGEAIAWHLQEALQLKKLNKTVYRIVFNEINKKAISNALDEKSSVDMKLVAAQEARRIMDRLIGYTVSPMLGNKLSAGRVQSPATRLIVDREREINQFVPIEFFDVKATMDKPMLWSALWDHSAYRPKDQGHWLDKAMTEVVAKTRQLTVLSTEISQRYARPPAPLTTSSLQQAASNKLKLSPSETMKLAQNLFAKGAITYHRTDSPNLSDDAIADVMKQLKADNLACAGQANKWKAKAGAQEAHEAIRPADCSVEIAGETEMEQALYQLIRERTLASQMPDAVFDVIDICLQSDCAVPIDGKPALFKAHGEVVSGQKGWLSLTKNYENDDDEAALPALPTVSKGAVFEATCAVISKKTKPPGRYTEASLVKKLEELEIGRPSTYAAILKGIGDRDYVTISKKRQLEPTEKGKNLIGLLSVAKLSFMDYSWTRQIEKRLDLIANGKDTYRAAIGEMFATLTEELRHLPDNSGRKILESIPCPCAKGGTIEVTEKAFKCTGCDTTIWKSMAGRIISQPEALALLSGETLSLDGFFSPKKGTQFAANVCIEDKKASFKFDSAPTSSQMTSIKCQCGGTVADHGKKWQCTDCQSTIWKVISQRTIDEHEALILFGGGSIEMQGLTSSKGKSFNAIVVLSKGKIEFQFQ